MTISTVVFVLARRLGVVFWLLIVVSVVAFVLARR
jgi:hypothetical protein